MLKVISNTVGRREFCLAPDAAEALVNYRWPGNIRELHNALMRAAALARSETITFTDLPDSIRHPVSTMSVPSTPGIRLKDFEREHIPARARRKSDSRPSSRDPRNQRDHLWRKRRHYGIA